MTPLLIEPTDVLFFRDAIPMSGGQGKGVGCRLPFPSTLHEAFRASLLRANGRTVSAKQEEGRPRHAPKRGNWHEQSWPEEDRRKIATRDFRSLRTIGPLPFLADPLTRKEQRDGRETGAQVDYEGLLLPVPADVTFETREHRETKADGIVSKWIERTSLRRFQLWCTPDFATRESVNQPADHRPLCLPLSVTPPDKYGQLAGWWTVRQYQAYLSPAADGNAGEDKKDAFFRPLPTADLWAGEHRVGVQIDPGSMAAAEGQLFAGSYLRAHLHTRFLAWAEIADAAEARNGEARQLDQLDWLLLGGEFRLARLWHHHAKGKPISDGLAHLCSPPEPPDGDGPCLLKWVLVTPAIFAHGSLPGWCWNSADGKPAGEVRLGASKRKASLEALPGRARLISWCLAKPRTVSGFDIVNGQAKPTMLAVPEGGVYYFLCENRPTALALARKLHWKPRSDFYGEKGCGYGLVSFNVRMHSTSLDVPTLAKELFKR